MPHHRNGVTDKLSTTLQEEVVLSYTNVDEDFSLTLRFRQNIALDYHNILWYKNNVIDSLCVPRENRGQVVDLGAAGSRIAHVVVENPGYRTIPKFVRFGRGRSMPVGCLYFNDMALHRRKDLFLRTATKNTGTCLRVRKVCCLSLSGTEGTFRTLFLCQYPIAPFEGCPRSCQSGVR